MHNYKVLTTKQKNVLPVDSKDLFKNVEDFIFIEQKTNIVNNHYLWTEFLRESSCLPRDNTFIDIRHVICGNRISRFDA